ncbi:helix-turn-helix domain-containing protein [Paenibacillus periandrae]|uniref:helix-turn-helix domain-containing protein n=1 Tax=Paenibacillus periandrae TaxID=1761741 RepID=UPI001F089B24|nr:helix-turn-helix domain-containing protein [Paenibacillus periandrae]
MGLFTKLFGIMDKRRTWFRRSLLLLLTVIILPPMLLSISINVIATKELKEQINQTHGLLIQQMTQRVNQQLTQFEFTVRNWAVNQIFGDYLEHVDFYQELSTIRSIMNALGAMENSISFIKNIEIYIADQDLLISNMNGVSRIYNTEKRDRYRDAFKRPGDMYWSYGLNESSNVLNKDMALMHKIPAESSHPFGAIIVEVDPVKFSSFIGQINPYREGYTLLMNENQELLSAGTFEKREDAALLASGLKGHDGEGNYVFSWNGNEYLISNGIVPRMKWKFLLATPIYKLTEPVVLVTRIIAGITAVTFIILLILAWVASRRLYSPISRMMSLFVPEKSESESEPPVHQDEIEFIESRWAQLTTESLILQDRLETQMPSLCEGFLYQLIYGHYYHLSEADIRKRLKNYSLDLGSVRVQFVLIQISGISRLQGKFSEDDEQLITFAAYNIIQELIGVTGHGVSVFNFQDLKVGFLLKFPAGMSVEEEKQTTMKLSSEMIQTLERLLKMDVTVVIGQPEDELRAMHASYEQTEQALRYRSVHETAQILYLEDLIIQGEGAAFYPFELEKELLQALRIGNVEESTALFKQFVAAFRQNADIETVLHQGMLQLLGSVLHVVYQTGHSPQKVFGLSNLYEELLQHNELQQMCDCFEKLVMEPFIEHIVESQNVKLVQLAEDVKATIHSKYMTDLSLEMCADLHHVDPFRLSKAFKEVTGINFIDYVTDYRIKKSKELLKNSNLRINEIAEMVGYQSTYFNRIFKKKENMTPGQFREKEESSPLWPG